MQEDSTDDEFAKTIKDLADVAKKLGSVSDVMDKVFRESIEDLHKTIIALPKEIALEHDDVRSTSAKVGAVSAFDRPLSAIIAGPKPLPVSIVGGLPGIGGSGRATTPGKPDDDPSKRTKPPKPSDVESGFIRRAFDNSRFGRAKEWAETKVTDVLGGKKVAATPGAGGGAAKGAAAGGSGGGGAGGLAKGAGWAAVAIEGAKALNEFRKAVQEASEEALRSARQYAETSAQMAAVFAKKDIQDLIRDRKKGDALAESTGKLADAQSRRQDAVAPFEVAFTKIQNNVLAFFEEKFADGLERARVISNKIIEVLTLGAEKEFFKGLDPDPADPFGYGAIFASAAKLDGRRLADLAPATAARVRAGVSAPMGAVAPGRLP